MNKNIIILMVSIFIGAKLFSAALKFEPKYKRVHRTIENYPYIGQIKKKFGFQSIPAQLNFLSFPTENIIFLLTTNLLKKNNEDSLDARDENNNTLLHVAISMSKIDIVTCLIDLKSNLDAQNNRGETPLHLAICSQNQEIINILLKAGANKNIKDSKNQTPLERAHEIYKGIIKIFDDKKEENKDKTMSAGPGTGASAETETAASNVDKPTL